jgi:SH3-like domain-containing protein
LGVSWRLITKVIPAAALLALTSGCSTQPKRAPVLAEAFVGPATLNLRSDIPLESTAVAVVKHGERIEIIGRRRRFMRVRTASGTEGWTDERQLLGASDMADLKDLAARASKMPSQGTATTYRELNVHTQPASGSPSFLRLKEGDKFDMVAQLVVPRTAVDRKPLIPPPPKKEPAAKKPKKQPKIPPPPMPPAPSPPKNWLELSQTDVEESDDPPPPPEEKPVPTDYWSLVRTSGGQSGWVLTRLISMAIPDEVAQYAEGHRIVTYHALGSVADGGEKKPIWLWTTINGRQEWDFASFRVFVWSLRRHRYETAYIERNLHGYLPVLLNEVDFATKGESTKQPGFSVCVEKAGRKVRREYALLGQLVRYSGERPCETPAPVWMAKAGGSATSAVPESAPPAESLGKRLKDRVKSWFGRK